MRFLIEFRMFVLNMNNCDCLNHVKDGIISFLHDPNATIILSVWRKVVTVTMTLTKWLPEWQPAVSQVTTKLVSWQLSDTDVPKLLIPILSPVVALQVAITMIATTCGAASDGKVGIITSHGFQCCSCIYVNAPSVSVIMGLRNTKLVPLLKWDYMGFSHPLSS